MHSWNLLHAAVHPTSRLTFPVVNSKGSIHVRSYFVLPRVTVLYTWSCLLSLVRFVESEISSLHGPVKLNLIYQDKRRFGELSLTANLGDPFCGFQHPKCCRNLSIVCLDSKESIHRTSRKKVLPSVFSHC